MGRKKQQKTKQKSEFDMRLERIEKELESGKITLAEALREIESLKELYKKSKTDVKDPEQSWHAFIGNRFEKLVRLDIEGFLRKKVGKLGIPTGRILVLKDTDVGARGNDKKNDKRDYTVLYKKLAIDYGGHKILPDADIIIAYYDPVKPEKSRVLAIISCKTSLRERIAQACYWKTKLRSGEETRDIKVFLVTLDKDGDFKIVRDPGNNKRVRYNGKSRNRVIAEAELDGVYIVRADFKDEGNNVKRYEKIYDDILKLIEETVGRT